MHKDEKHPPYAVLLLLVLLGMVARFSWLDHRSQELENSHDMAWSLAILEGSAQTASMNGMTLTMPDGRWAHQAGRGGTRGRGQLHRQPLRAADVGGFASPEDDREKRAGYLLVLEKTAQLEGLDAEARELEARTRKVEPTDRRILLAQVTQLQSHIQGALRAVRGAEAIAADDVRLAAHLQRQVAELRTRVERAPARW